jgi:hypothetical protein
MTLPDPPKLANPPKLATWLLERLSSGCHRESLEGDLFEEYAGGRTRFWYWRQVIIAIFVARKSAVSLRLLNTVRRVFFHLLAEVSVVVGIVSIVSIVDESRRTHSFREMWRPAFAGTLALLAAIALLGFIGSRRGFGFKRRSAVINHLIAVFALVALGAGTFTWAATARSPCKGEKTCLCSKIEGASIKAEWVSRWTMPRF